ncbi:MAG: NRDE family protein [Acidobacteria bacterium]|nr:NRDE family protein [Acidobacteriota bacterium]
MCTVSWIHEEGGYQLFSNRDEKHTRKPALPPSVREKCSVRFIAPIDGDQRGSWIGVNRFGLSLCLLNRYQDESTPFKPDLSYTSRGLLLIELIDCRSQAQARIRIGDMDLMRFRPFTLLVLEPGHPALLFHWTRRERLIVNDGEAEMPLISSSHDLPGVISSRRQIFRGLIRTSGNVDANLLHTFHSSHFPEASAYSTCMHRDDARTVSFSRARVSRERI